MSAIQVCQLFIDTIASVENRCMAADGPVTPTCNEITDDELRKVYEAATAAIPKRATIADAPQCLNTNDKAMWMLGFNAAIEGTAP